MLEQPRQKVSDFSWRCACRFDGARRLGHNAPWHRGTALGNPLRCLLRLSAMIQTGAERVAWEHPVCRCHPLPFFQPTPVAKACWSHHLLPVLGGRDGDRGRSRGGYTRDRAEGREVVLAWCGPARLGRRTLASGASAGAILGACPLPRRFYTSSAGARPLCRLGTALLSDHGPAGGCWYLARCHLASCAHSVRRDPIAHWLQGDLRLHCSHLRRLVRLSGVARVSLAHVLQTKECKPLCRNRDEGCQGGAPAETVQVGRVYKAGCLAAAAWNAPATVATRLLSISS